MDIGEVKAALRLHYSGLGKVRSIEVLPVKVVSSEIFSFVTEKGSFCLKVPRYRKVQSRGGTEQEYESWLLVADIRDKLYDAGVPVERGVRSDGGNLVERYGDAYCWVSPFYPSDPFRGTPEQITAAACVSARFHVAGRRLLKIDTGLREKITGLLFRDMPLSDSLARLDETCETLANPTLSLHKPHCIPLTSTLAEVRRRFDAEVRPHISEVKACQADAGKEEDSLVHNDFHPGNVLYTSGTDEALMLDFEQMTIGPRMKCLAFSVSRFGFESEVCHGQSVPEAVRSFVRGYRRHGEISEEQLRSLPNWIRSYELEKILRILRKFLADGSFTQNLERILTHHIPVFAGAGRFTLDN
jgi:Ser/Thr protein kinase RdoA (MazF antagonist)